MIGPLAQAPVLAMLVALGADPAKGPRPEVPAGGSEASWAHIAKEQQDQAMALFDRANEELYQSHMPEAVELYHQALQRWDHPAFHYNLAIALMAQSKTLECHEQLEMAVKYGPEPLQETQKYRNAVSMLTSIEGQLAKLELSCEQPEVQVILDDRKGMLSCPGSFWEWTRPGIHIVEVTKDGFHPTTRNLNLKPGEKVSLPLKVYTEEEWTHTRSRWPVWMPWTVIGSGAALAAVGGGLHVFARRQYLDYDTGIRTCANGPEGQPFAPCDVSSDLTQMLGRADLSQGVAWGAYIAGGAVVATGAVLLSLNFPQPFLIDPENGSSVAIAPLIAPHSGGIQFVLGF